MFPQREILTKTMLFIKQGTSILRTSLKRHLKKIQEQKIFMHRLSLKKEKKQALNYTITKEILPLLRAILL